MKALVTGGCGFIGHHLVEHLLKTTDWEVAVMDRLSYASNGFDRLRDIAAFDDRRVRIFTADFSRPMGDGITRELRDCEYVFHLGAESHVDRSIEDAVPFVLANVLGTTRILDLARKMPRLRRFFYFSTDEVFGPAPGATAYKEWDRYDSGNPYSASKAGGEEMCLAYANTHKVPVVITHCMNVFGERQHPEKFVPLVINKCLSGEVLKIHANAERTKAGSRFYIHARNVSAAVMSLLDAPVREKFNICGQREVDNLELARMIADVVGKPLRFEMVDFHSSRPGHDLRYGLDGSKMAARGWHPPVEFETSLEKTVRWFLNHQAWLCPEATLV